MADWKKLVLTVGIAIIFAFFVGFGIEAFYPHLEWEDYCDRKPTMPHTMESCIEAGGEWEGSDMVPVEGPLTCSKLSEDNGSIMLQCNQKGGLMRDGFCDINSACDKEYDTARDLYNRNVFFIATIAGILAVIIGGLLLSKESVGSGLMAGGVLSVIYGTMRYWEALGNIIRFVLLGVVLAVLIWIAYKKVKD